MIRIQLSLGIGEFVVSFGLAILLGVLDFTIANKFMSIVAMQQRLVETFRLAGTGLIFVLTGLASSVFIMRLSVQTPSSNTVITEPVVQKLRQK